MVNARLPRCPPKACGRSRRCGPRSARLTRRCRNDGALRRHDLGPRSRSHAPLRARVSGQFSWDRTSGRVFDEVYPKAFAASRDRQRVETAWPSG